MLGTQLRGSKGRRSLVEQKAEVTDYREELVAPEQM